MVRLIDDGTEHVYESPLTEEIQELLIKAGPELLSAVKTANEACLTLNVGPEVIGDEGCRALTAMRAPLVFRLLVFRDHLLPLSKDTVRAVRETLTYYFKHPSFEEFKTALPTLKKKLDPHTERTGVTKNKFMILAAELEILKVDSTKEVEEVIPKLREVLQVKNKEALKLKNSAKRADSLGSMFLAKGLITTGGLIVGIPSLAPLVVTAALYMAATGKQEAAKKAKMYAEEEKAVTKMHDELLKTIEALQDVNRRGIEKFAFCLQGCSDFFAYLKSQLETLSTPEGVDDGDEVLRIMHRGLKREASEVIKACRAYEANASQVETGIQVLEQFKPAKYEELLEEWVYMSDEKAAEMKRVEVIGGAGSSQN